MPKLSKRILNWYPARNCWRKKYQGKTYYLATGGRCNSEDDIDGYLAAMAEWSAIKKTIDNGGDRGAIDPPSKPVRPTLDIKLPLRQLPPKPDTLAPFAFDYSKLSSELPASFHIAGGQSSVAELLEAYLAEYRRSAQSGEKAITTYRAVKSSLDDFKGFAEKYGLTIINNAEPKRFAQLLNFYRDCQLDFVAKGECSAYTAKGRLAQLRRFLEWAYERECIDTMPRVVGRNFAKVSLPDPSPHPFTLDEIKTLWNATIQKHKFARKSYRNSLYLLLGINCGYRAGDIATLQHSHLIQHNGAWVLNRKREKTGSPQCHKLWPLTYELLLEEMTDPASNKIMLLDERGGPLVTETLDKKTGNTDCIGRSFFRLNKKIGFTGAGKGHSALRDTGAQTLRNQYPSNPVIVKQYLGHKERDVVRHYVTSSLESYSPLFEALDWMQSYFDLKR